MNNKIYSHGVGLFRVIALGVMSLITLVGIADAQVTGKVTQGVTVKTSVPLWSENNYTIIVCWETTGYDREKAIVKRAVTSTWERNSNLSFIWEVCYPGLVSPTFAARYANLPYGLQLARQAAEEGPKVVIRISPQGKDNAGAGGSARLGVAALSLPRQLYPGVNMSFNPDGTADEGRVEYIAVHEFGHVLGFVHEQDGPNHNRAHCSGGTEKNATSLTNYDPDSVMNYCNKDGNMKGNLTGKDIEGLQRIYGAPSGSVTWSESTDGMLLAGKFRSRPELSRMTPEDKRNTLITELANRTKSPVSYYQSLNNNDLAGAGALLVSLRASGTRTDQQIKAMSAEDLRNTVVVEANVRTNRGIGALQALSNMDMAKLIVKRRSE
jgi:hypothetical protein